MPDSSRSDKAAEREGGEKTQNLVTAAARSEGRPPSPSPQRPGRVIDLDRNFRAPGAGGELQAGGRLVAVQLHWLRPLILLVSLLFSSRSPLVLSPFFHLYGSGAGQEATRPGGTRALLSFICPWHTQPSTCCQARMRIRVLAGGTHPTVLASGWCTGCLSNECFSDVRVLDPGSASIVDAQVPVLWRFP